MARVLKNLRSRLITEGMLKSGVAPSYYLEGLLYNVPDSQFGKSFDDTFVNSALDRIEALPREVGEIVINTTRFKADPGMDESYLL